MAMTALRRGAPLALLLCPVLLGGCFMYATREDFQIAQKDIADLNERLKKQEERHAADLARIHADTAAQMATLKDLTEQATQVVTRNSANLGQGVDLLKQQLAVITGRVDINENTLTGLSKSFNDFRSVADAEVEKLKMQSGSAQSPPVPESPDGLFAEARKHYDAREYVEAHRLLDAFINRYPKDARAAQALYLQGDSYFLEHKYPAAINTFGKVIDLFPKSEVAPDAMYKNGQAFYALKYCGDARIYFQELLRRYPKTEWKKDANDQLKRIARDLKNHDLCTS
jgi:tol-pal system protein YbgF